MFIGSKYHKIYYVLLRTNGASGTSFTVLSLSTSELLPINKIGHEILRSKLLPCQKKWLFMYHCFAERDIVWNECTTSTRSVKHRRPKSAETSVSSPRKLSISYHQKTYAQDQSNTVVAWPACLEAIVEKAYLQVHLVITNLAKMNRALGMPTNGYPLPISHLGRNYCDSPSL